MSGLRHTAVVAAALVALCCGAFACAFESAPITSPALGDVPAGAAPGPGAQAVAVDTTSTDVPSGSLEAPSDAPADVEMDAAGDGAPPPMPSPVEPLPPPSGQGTEPLPPPPQTDADPGAPSDPDPPAATPVEPDPDAGTVIEETDCQGVTSDVVLSAPLVVGAGTTFDGMCQRIAAGWTPDPVDPEPLIRLEQGSRLVNIVLGWPPADGIHTHGDVTLSNVVWERIGDDALTIREPGTVKIEGGSAVNGDNTVFQVNAPSTFRISNFVARNADKLVRQNGGTTFQVDLYIDACDISDMAEAIFRTDSDVSSVTMTSTRYSNIGGPLFMGVNPLNVTTSGNAAY